MSLELEKMSYILTHDKIPKLMLLYKKNQRNEIVRMLTISFISYFIVRFPLANSGFFDNVPISRELAMSITFLLCYFVYVFVSKIYEDTRIEDIESYAKELEKLKSYVDGKVESKNTEEI